ncbi:MAG: polysaccharide deacetylase family protein [Chloroflexi bacterium]|nr:polysaccharide deacetylase family protein [Chloroflexota bacterium]
MAESGCSPTFPTPGRVVQRHHDFIRRVQASGAEIAVHGFEHVDLGVYKPEEASQQLVKASHVFAEHGIGVHGFRCPYLRCPSGLWESLPKDLFVYSSNRAIWWDVVSTSVISKAARSFGILGNFYQPASAAEMICTPWIRSQVVEIPVSLPDDLQIYDGLRLGAEGLTQIWTEILHRTYRRGELFVLQFHPELAWRCQQSFQAVLEEARHLKPSVWIARLRDIGQWWREKSDFQAAVNETPSGLHFIFTCSTRATILARGIPGLEQQPQWDGSYHRVQGLTLDVPAQPRPLVGIADDVPAHMISFLADQGYILDTGPTARECSIFLDAATLSRLPNQVQIVNMIEQSQAPLVRYWRWPDGARSAVSITGDLDALSLVDYLSRLIVK